MGLKVGILGGTFDPIHSGHIAIAQAAKKQLALDLMWLMPAPTPPHKDKSLVTADVHRLMMTMLSLPDESIEMNVFEFNREGKSYTSDTLTAIENEHPDGEYYYLMGEDSLQDFPKWHEPETIVRIAKIGVAIREENREHFTALLAERNKQFGDAFIALDTKYQPVSSTMLREAIAFGEHADLIAPRALSYIHHFGLYGTKPTAIRPETISLYENIYEKLEKKLSPHRLRHCTGVAHLAAEFLQAHEERNGTVPAVDGYYESVQKAYIAGLLHDCAKYMPPGEYPAFCETHGIPVTQSELRSPELLHAKVGSYFAANEYGINDREIHAAIEKHCTGDTEMTPLELAVYTADFCEPFRDHRPLGRTLQTIRLTGYEDLTLAAWMATDSVLEFIRSMDWSIDPMTGLMLDSLEKKIRQKGGKGSKMNDYTSKDLAKTAYAALDNKKAFDIRVIEIDKVSTIADYFVIADGNNASQVEAMVDEVQMMLYKTYGIEPKRVEGAKNSGWILMDYGDIVVHVFSSQDRLFYDLERVWRDGSTLDTSDWGETPAEKKD
ncbi:MAG: nicotinate (nicotinamide) nucleotide adenylyltransferase [Lachnospiraceae bacterium]|nr:nicotinate (nicotinamide) nucleotide adenylyltransferase [Lachnospiraceae bacterium]